MCFVLFCSFYSPILVDYKNGEAVEINNGFGKQLGYMKPKLEAYKLLKEIPTREELWLPKSNGKK